MRAYRLATLVVAALLLSSLLLVGGAGADDGGRVLTTTLTGAAEVPGPGDPDGTGTAVLRLNPGQGEICYDLTVENLSTVTGAHIHVGTVTQAGPVVVPLTPPTSGESSGCATVDRVLVLAIIMNPENYYVNVHSTEFPAGAVRGQLAK